MNDWLRIAQDLLENPTAPLMEVLPQKFVREFAVARSNLALSQDAAGNLRVDYSAGAPSRPPLVLVAHLDHPGFHVTNAVDAKIELSFQGSVALVHAIPGSRVHFFETGNAQPIGEGELLESTGESGRLERASARLLSGTAKAGDFAMWAFPGFALKDELISARCCDDLLGAAVALCVLDEISKRAPENIALTGFFTRAEELGFLGTLEAIRLNTLPKDACILSLECSKAFAHAPQGAGAIVRVGDAASIFDPGLTQALTTAAKKLAEKNSGFKHQRKLMDGGVCEATPFCAHGYRASGLALPLGNYHNQAFDQENEPCIGAESVNAADFRCEIELLIELALHPELLDEERNKIPVRLQELSKKAQQLLAP
jgi:endoglucanase